MDRWSGWVLLMDGMDGMGLVDWTDGITWIRRMDGWREWIGRMEGVDELDVMDCWDRMDG